MISNIPNSDVPSLIPAPKVPNDPAAWQAKGVVIGHYAGTHFWVVVAVTAFVLLAFHEIDWNNFKFTIEGEQQQMLEETRQHNRKSERQYERMRKQHYKRISKRNQ